MNVWLLFFQHQKRADYELTVQLINKGIISTPGKSFEISDAKEFVELRSNGVFYIDKYGQAKQGNVKIFYSRLAGEIKGKETDHPYETARLDIQAYDD